VKQADLWGADQNLEFPLITKSGINQSGKVVRYYFNYSDCPASFEYPHNDGVELLTEAAIQSEQAVEVDAWGVIIIEEN
jgi:beta-galactosidase